jgi:hypothetical protein
MGTGKRTIQSIMALEKNDDKNVKISINKFYWKKQSLQESSQMLRFRHL